MFRTPLIQSSHTSQTAFVLFSLALSIFSYGRFCTLVIQDITNYLGIACFTVRYVSLPPVFLLYFGQQSVGDLIYVCADDTGKRTRRASGRMSGSSRRTSDHFSLVLNTIMVLWCAACCAVHERDVKRVVLLMYIIRWAWTEEYKSGERCSRLRSPFNFWE